MFEVCRETTNFVHACQALHILLDNGVTLTHHDRELIEFSGSELLDKLRPA